ncbi:epoxyqueuosine reductase [Fusibacter ferrireducens]|uniref:4Fe-4S ferredoxin-type domain-containing protein n=1 Tax=Fusibacter ferrireducens TaxID=2785058 RepID=A0ABS0A0C3_9FIRM|nr:4Fe-4S double cluster binding domain-containing protein [Fusibacter ferrireducens]MBF4695686.1 hypothetical protein [Fusibacter ferrireducens]
MNLNMKEKKANFNVNVNTVNTAIGILFSQMDGILSQAQLSYYDFLYMGLESIKKMRAHERALIEDIQLDPFRTEFEPEPHKRSFFNMLEKKIKPGESLMLFSVALPYPRQTTGLSKSLGVVDGSSWYYDYHYHLRARMDNALKIFSEIEGIRIKESDCFVDTSDYIDRELAFLCGLGSYGKNHMLIHPELGTQFHIGHMYMILGEQEHSLFSKVESESALNARRHYTGCKECDKCVKACPAGICGVLKMNRLKCISYLTQTKRALTLDEMKRMRNRIYGCDICQNACPSNRARDENKTNLRHIDHWLVNDFEGIDLLESLKLSQRAFKRQYGERGFAWRGGKIFKRNILIAIGNSKDPSFFKSIKELAELNEDVFLQPYYEYALIGTKPV